MRIEMYGATRPQEGRTANEDAFLIEHGSIPFAALCDGAGNAEQVARRVLNLFRKLFQEATLARILSDATWSSWIKLLDSSLLGGAQSTFLGVAMAGSQLVGTCAGDSRAYLVDRNGSCNIITADSCKFRLGSGKAKGAPISLNLQPRDIFLLLSDGAWTPLSPYLLQKAVVSAALKHFSEVPQAVLDASSRTGRPDDMTALALRILR